MTCFRARSSIKRLILRRPTRRWRPSETSSDTVMVSFLVIYVLYTYMTVVASRALHSLQSDQLAYLTRRNSLRAQLAQAGRLRRFRQLVAVGIEDQPVMMVGRRRWPEQHLQQAVNAGR